MLASPRIRLARLELANAGTGDGSMAALATVVHGGRFKHLDWLVISHNAAVTDDGMCTVAHAIEEAGKHGLPMLRKLIANALRPVTLMGVSALSLALINNCPRLKNVDLSGRENEAISDKAVMEGMLRAVGRRQLLASS